jgi:Lar family restriction alleviation protein
MTMADPIREALEPCPFCGGTRIRTTHIRDGRACGCGDCGAELHAFHPDAEAKAIKLWNTRALSLLTTKASDDELVERVANNVAEIESDIAYLERAYRNCDGRNIASYIKTGLKYARAARAAISSMPTIADEGERARETLSRISDLLACSVGGGVHFAVEPDISGIEIRFRKRDEAGEMSRILTDLHPVDEEGCFVHGRALQSSASASVGEG